MSLCNELVKTATGPVNTCVQPGGIDKTVWLGNVDHWNGDYTVLPSGEISGFTMEAGKRLWSYEGKHFEHNSNTEIERAESGYVGFPQTLTLVLYYRNQTEQNDIISLVKSEGLGVFARHNNGAIKVYGQKYGLKATGYSDSSGTALADGSGKVTVTLTGSEETPPTFFKTLAGSTLADDMEYLEAKLVPAVAP